MKVVIQRRGNRRMGTGRRNGMGKRRRENFLEGLIIPSLKCERSENHALLQVLGEEQVRPNVDTIYVQPVVTNQEQVKVVSYL